MGQWENFKIIVWNKDADRTHTLDLSSETM